MDIATLVRKVQRSFGDDNQIFISEADLLDWINDAQAQIARETSCITTTVSTAASNFPYTFPSDFIRVKILRYGTKPLVPVEVEDLDMKQYDLTQRGQECYFYYVENDKINLFPLQPSGDTTTVTFRYAALPTVVTAVGNSLTVPVQFHEDLVRYCLARAHERNENYRGMEIAMSEFQARISARKEDVDNPDDTWSVVRDDPWEGGFFL